MNTAKRILSEYTTKEQWAEITQTLAKDIKDISEDIYSLIDKKAKEALDEKVEALQKKMEQLIKARKKMD